MEVSQVQRLCLNLHSNMDRLKPEHSAAAEPAGRFTFQYG